MIDTIIGYHFNDFCEPSKTWFEKEYGREWLKTQYETYLKINFEGNTQKFVDLINKSGHHIGIMILTNVQLKDYAQQQLDQTNIMDFLHYKHAKTIQNMGYISQGPQLNLYVFNFPEGNQVKMK